MHDANRPAGNENESATQAAIAPSPLVYEPNILVAFAEDVQRCGLVGEKKIAKLIYLAITGRVLPRPPSLAVKGPSSGGKSHNVKMVLRFFPPSAYHELTAMSEKALAYTELDLRHRFIVLYEAAGMGQYASYLMRSLLSEGCIKYEVVESTDKGIGIRHIEKEGPTGLLVTTTAANLHPENETRMFSVTVQDTPEQTRAVYFALAGQEQAVPDLSPWHELQEWLATAKHEVVIPYAMSLAAMVPTTATRLRRDFGALLSLIKAHAILHQATREVDGQGRIIATLDDYAAVRDLVADVMAEGVHSSVSGTVRETVNAVGALVPDSAPFEFNTAGPAGVTVKQVADYLGIHKSNASRRVHEAIEAGYLIDNAWRKNGPLCLALGDPMPDDMDILPTVERLRGCAENGETPTASATACESETGVLVS